MPDFRPPSPITAIVYDDGPRMDRQLREIVGALKSAGLNLAGFVQHAKPRKGRSRCDMVLEDLHSGERIEISEDRGEHARGCMLAVQQLMRASAAASGALDAAPDLLVVNKFGKTEAEGGGFRALIAEAMAREIPIVIAVPQTNLEKWRAFTEGYVTEHALSAMHGDSDAVCRAMGLLPVTEAV